MGAFESFKTFMNKPSKDYLAEANGKEAIDELAYRRAHREKEATLAHTSKLGSTAINHSELESQVEAGHAEFGTDIGEKKLGLPAKNDQYHIPDVEPTVTKVEETAEAENKEQIAA